jgi:hypothetical protein
MPYNIFYIAFFAVALGIAVALLTRFGKPAPPPEVLPEAAYEERAEHALEANIGESELRQVALRLLERHGIEVEGEDRNSEQEFYLLGRSDDPVIGGRYVVNCRVAEPDEVLRPERILEFRDFVRAQGLTRGVFITSGYFAKEGRFLVEDAAVSLLSRGDMTKLLEE